MALFGDIAANATVTNFPPAGNVVGDSDSMVLTNKRINIRFATLNNPANVTPASDTMDAVTITALAQACGMQAPSGTPVEGQVMVLRILDNGSAQNLTWNGVYQGGAIGLPATSLGSTTLSLILKLYYDSSLTKWRLTDKIN